MWLGDCESFLKISRELRDCLEDFLSALLTNSHRLGFHWFGRVVVQYNLWFDLTNTKVKYEHHSEDKLMMKLRYFRQ